MSDNIKINIQAFSEAAKKGIEFANNSTSSNKSENKTLSTDNLNKNQK